MSKKFETALLQADQSLQMTSQFQQFPKIRPFHYVSHKQVNEPLPETVRYGAKVKLHGTNAAIRINGDNTVCAQKRSGDVPAEKDNAGFATWLSTCRHSWISAVRKVEELASGTIVIFGEWAGRNVQKMPADAVTKLPDRNFFVFGILVDNTYYSDPEFIKPAVPDIPHVFVIPWFLGPELEEMRVCFGSDSSVIAFTNVINDAVTQVSKTDPYIKEMFGIEGPGEGIVATIEYIEQPNTSKCGHVSLEEMVMYIFKAKSKLHGEGTGPAVRIAPLVPSSLQNFVVEFVTEARCCQGRAEVFGDAVEGRLIRDFISWVRNDVYDESGLERKAMGIEWEEVKGLVCRAASIWIAAEYERSKQSR